MPAYIKSLGWYIRFVPATHTNLSRFYVETLGFPFVRAGTGQHVDFFWAGESLIHELIFEGRTAVVPEHSSDPAASPLVPVYRVTDIEALSTQLRAKGIGVSAITRYAMGRECYLQDPLGSLIGIREADTDSPLPQDIEARRRARRGEGFNVGCASMPTFWQELGWVVRRVADVDAMKRFYVDVLGLALVTELEGRVLLDLGDNSLLELAPGGQVVAPPVNRAELPATFILRIQNITAFKAEMQRHGVRVVHDVIQWARGSLSYVADPEGNLIGVEERYHPGSYAGQTPFPEDLEAQRRWIEYRSTSGRAPTASCAPRA